MLKSSVFATTVSGVITNAKQNTAALRVRSMRDSDAAADLRL